MTVSKRSPALRGLKQKPQERHVVDPYQGLSGPPVLGLIAPDDDDDDEDDSVGKAQEHLLELQHQLLDLQHMLSKADPADLSNRDLSKLKEHVKQLKDHVPNVKAGISGGKLSKSSAKQDPRTGKTPSDSSGKRHDRGLPQKTPSSISGVGGFQVAGFQQGLEAATGKRRRSNAKIG